MRKNSILGLFAPPKNYKSFTLNTILVELLMGGNLFNVVRSHARKLEQVFPIQPVKRVLLLEQEIGLEDTQGRLRDLVNSLKPAERKVVENGFYARSCDYNLRLDRDMGVKYITQVVEEVKPDILCIDPLTKFHTSDENSNTEMSRIMIEMRKLIHSFDLTLILVHHIGKYEEGKSLLDLIRGASAIGADIDTGMLFHVVNRPASIVWVDTELRRGRPLRSFQIKLDHTTLRMGFNKWSTKNSYKAEALEQEIHQNEEPEGEQ